MQNAFKNLMIKLKITGKTEKPQWLSNVAIASNMATNHSSALKNTIY